LSSTAFTQCAPETTEFGEITQNDNSLTGAVCSDGLGDPWVMGHMGHGQELNGSLGSWVTRSDPFPALTHTD